MANRFSQMSSLTLMLLSMAHYSLRRQLDHNSFVLDHRPSSPHINNTYYDFIIIGAGTAGCVLAHRLHSRLPNATILILEAGGPQSLITDMIGNTQYLIGGEFDWNYHVQPQMNAGLAYPQFSITRGKVLGGTSTTQWGIYNRGNRHDFDNWAHRYRLGPDWTWPHILPYFLRFENRSDNLSTTVNNNNGLVWISTETKVDPILLRFQELMNQLGYPTIDLNNNNGTNQHGTTISQMFYNSKTGLKSSTANSYLESIWAEHHPRFSPQFNMFPNKTLTILTRAHVQKILLSNDHILPKANGVMFTLQDGQLIVVHARNEILLTAGPINTPQILMLSGIGPADHLNDLKIPLRINLPGVGGNLHDMVFVPLYYRIANRSLIEPYPFFNVANLYEYFHASQGPLAHHADGVTYYQTSQVNSDLNWPDTMIISVVEFFDDLNGTLSQYVNNRQRWRQYWLPYSNDGFYLAIDPVLARPKSRGTVRLNASNPFGEPLIDPQYLSDERDFQALLEVTRFTVNSLRNHPIDGIEMFPPIPVCPPFNCDGVSELLCETYLHCHIRQLARSYYNFAGTARMGLPGAEDPDAVVDSQFRVIGTRNLRVIDASVMPEAPNGHIIASTIMLAEKASDIILRDHHSL